MAASASAGPWEPLKRAAKQNMIAVGRIVGATGISPNALTLFGLLLNIAAAAIVATGYLLLGGIAFLVASAFDMLDGAVARATGRTSTFGAFLDSVIDRYDEGVIFIGLLVASSVRGDTQLVIGASVALLGSLLVSYTRARAEGLGLDCEVGLLQRPERVILLGVGLILASLAPIALTLVVWSLAILTNWTAIQRILYVRALLNNGGDTDRSER